MVNYFKKLLVGTLTTLMVVGAPTSALADAVIFSGNDVKTLKDNINLNGKTKILSGSTDPTSSAVSAPIGSMYMNTTNGNLYKKQDAGSSTNWVKLSVGGDAGVNYVTNPNAEQDTTSWTTYADAAQNIPVDATGGAPSSTWTRTTSTPLTGTGAFLWTRTANNRQGEGVSTPFTINNSDQARPLSIKFDYKVVSGTFFAADGITAPLNDGTTSVNAGMSDLEVFVYDVTNSVLIPVSGQVLTSTSATSASFRGTFQTASNSTSYRLAIHTARSTAVAFTAQFDSFFVGPQTLVQGAPITDWVAYTPTYVALGTVVSAEAFYQRVGDSVNLRGRGVAGTSTGSVASISLPAGMSLDTTKETLASAIYGIGTNGGSATVFAMIAGTTPGNTIQFGRITNSASLAGAIGTDVASGGTFSWYAYGIPISGFSSTVQMSNDTDTRAVTMRATSAGTSLVSSTLTTVINPTVVRDTHGAYNSTTGIYTVPVSGDYRVSGAGTLSKTWGQNTYFQSEIQVNGVAKTYGLTSFPATSAAGLTGQTSVMGTVTVVAGDQLKLVIQQTATGTTSLDSSATSNYFEVTRVSGPATVASSESVNMQSTGTATGGGSGGAIIVFPTLGWDTHAGYSTSTGRYTVPISGKYQVSAFVDASNTAKISAYVNAVAGPGLCRTGTGGDGGGSNVVKVVAGDIIDIRPSTNVGGFGTGSIFSIVRVGN